MTVRRLDDRYSLCLHGEEDADDIPYPLNINPDLDSAMAGQSQRDFYVHIWPGESTVLNIDTKTPVA